MKKLFFLFIAISISLAMQAQKKNKGKDKDKTNYTVNDSLGVADTMPPPAIKTSGKKGKSVVTNYEKKDDKKDNKKSKNDKDDKKGKKEVATNFKEPETEPTPVADTSKRFTGIIKYRITSDDPADKDSVFIIFGEDMIRVTMFLPGYREGQIFEKNMIASLRDSLFYELDIRNMTYTKEKLGERNAGTEFTLENSKKTSLVMNLSCQEYKGEMTTPDGDTYEAACLLTNQYQYMAAMDYNFMNIQPLVKGYRIVLGFRTKSDQNENTYILAYKIEPGNTASYFDLSQFTAK